MFTIFSFEFALKEVILNHLTNERADPLTDGQTVTGSIQDNPVFVALFCMNPCQGMISEIPKFRSLALIV